MKSLRIILSTLVCCWSCLAQRGLEGVKSANLKDADLSLATHHDPASELANFTLMDGFQVNLFATEPMLANPVHMVWDSQGRLWVACSWAYPQLKPGEKADDKIIILEDVDQDGRADKSTVFAEGLYLPTGIELANGGCYIAQSPDVFFFRDTDGDDVADEKVTVLTGFGIEDSHHSISAWRRGPGGWIYFQEGIFLHTQVETQYGMVRNFNGGVYQYNPRTQKLQMFVRGTGGNPWGHVFDRWGQSYMVNNPRIMYLSPASGASNEPNRVAPLISTEKQCGGDLATGLHVPEEIRGQLLTCRFKSRTIIRYELIENGAGFSANVLPPLMASKHPNFRPVDCKIGPDGAVYVADWYNSIINHAQHDFRDPRRDHDHGRIWRISHKERPLIQKPKLVGESIHTLLDHLKSPNDWTRHQARKELSERDPESVLKATETWVDALDATEPGYGGHLVESMWACQNVERSSESILRKIIGHKDGHARSAAARVIRYWHESLSDPVGMIARLAADPFPRTRMEAVLSAGFIPKAEAFTAALHVLDHERDKFINAALEQTVSALRPYWQPAFAGGGLTFANITHREYAERFGRLDLGERLDDFLKNRSPDPDTVANFKWQFIEEAEVDHVLSAFRSVTSRRSRLPRDSKLALLEALAVVGNKGGMDLGKRVPSLSSQLDSPDDALVIAVSANMGAWKMAGNGKDLLRLVQDGEQSGTIRTAAAEALGKIGEAAILEVLRTMARSGDMPSRYTAVYGLVHADLKEGAGFVANLLTEDPGDADPVGLVECFLKHQQGPTHLLEALKPDRLHPQAVAKVAAYHRRTGQLTKSLAKIFVPATPTSLSQQLLSEDRGKLTADVIQFGDPGNGERVFRRPSSACAVCHGIGSVGPAIGPNLAAVGAAADPAYMVEAILEPNQSIAEHFENVMLTLRDGTVRTGVITHKSEKEVILQDSANPGGEIRVALSSVRKQEALASLMPDGLADQLENRQEFLDLAKFLSLLGRPGDYQNDESPYIRKWLVASGEPDQWPDENAFWMPAYSMVNGSLPLNELEGGEVVYVKGFVQFFAAGAIKLDLNSTKGLRLWVDGKEIEDMTAPIVSTRGRKELTFAIDRNLRAETELCVLIVAADQNVKFKPEGGL